MAYPTSLFGMSYLKEFERQERIRVIEKLMTDPLGRFFRYLNPDNIPGYRDAIKKPMDLETVIRHLRKKSDYTNERFEKEMKLIVDNCRKFNKTNDDFVAAADEFEKMYKRKLNKIETTREKKFITELQRCAEKLSLLTSKFTKSTDNRNEDDKGS